MTTTSRLRPLGMALISLLLGALATTGALGCSSSSESGLDDEASGEPGDQSFEDVDDGSTSSSADELGGCYQCTNCVLYARCRQPRLPYGLTSYADKRARINRSTPRVGCVAVINTGSYYGHVAYVNSTTNGIHIDEGNWPSGHCGTRSGSASSLHIAGYICP